MPKRNRSTGRSASAESLARGLGWFSIALGAAQLVAPRTLGRLLGMEHQAGILQAYGAREIANGVGILTSEDPAMWVWGRVAGDVLDLATLAPGLGSDNSERMNVGIAMGTVAAVTLVDVCCASQLSAGNGARQPVRDYSGRSGFPEPPSKMRGKAPNPPPQYIPNESGARPAAAKPA